MSYQLEVPFLRLTGHLIPSTAQFSHIKHLLKGFVVDSATPGLSWCGTRVDVQISTVYNQNIKVGISYSYKVHISSWYEYTVNRFLNRQVWANFVELVQTVPLKAQSDQVLHCLPFRLYRLDVLLYG